MSVPLTSRRGIVSQKAGVDYQYSHASVTSTVTGDLSTDRPPLFVWQELRITE